MPPKRVFPMLLALFALGLFLLVALSDHAPTGSQPNCKPQTPASSSFEIVSEPSETASLPAANPSPAHINAPVAAVATTPDMTRLMAMLQQVPTVSERHPDGQPKRLVGGGVSVAVAHRQVDGSIAVSCITTADGLEQALDTKTQ